MMLSASRVPYQIDFIDHRNTKQKSLRVRLPGHARAGEVVVLGGHFDSINQGWGGGSKLAPGADDNASGSSNLLETLRVLIQQPQAARTIDFYWYAGEESGLLGSAEIARAAKEQNAQIVAVLQLDMTLFPGSGEFVIGSMNDFTSAWLRDFLVSINDTYLKVRIVEDACGYGCSDHASWYRQGYPTLMPFEATMRQSNRQIHTANDIVSNASSFRHSLVFSKIALIFAMEIGNSSMSQPY
jgi:leucyl aminopeptidase